MPQWLSPRNKYQQTKVCRALFNTNVLQNMSSVLFNKKFFTKQFKFNVMSRIGLGRYYDQSKNFVQY